MKILFKHENGFFKNERIFCEVYCLPENETHDELLNSGWLPSMEEHNIWYQSRSCRLDIDKFVISSKRKNILNKIDYFVEKYNTQSYVDNFFEKFYENKKYNIFDLYKNCSDFFDIKLLTIKHKELIVGFARFIEKKESNVFLNLSYLDSYPKLSLGTNSFFLLQEITRLQNKKYLYIYESYNDTFEYKSKFSNVEIWNGRSWIRNNKDV